MTIEIKMYFILHNSSVYAVPHKVFVVFFKYNCFVYEIDKIGKSISWPAFSICHGSKTDFKYHFMLTLMLSCFNKSKMFLRTNSG